MKTKNENGFTLIELIVIIVILGITLPLIIMPFATAAGAARPGDMAMLASVNRGNMEKELAGIDQNWPSLLDPAFSTNSFSQTIDGRNYTTTVTRKFVNALFFATDGNPVNGNLYLLLSVTSTDSFGYTLGLQTLRVRDY